MIAGGARLSVFCAAASQQKLSETRAAEPEKKAKTQGSILQQWMLPAQPHSIGESETRQLNELVLDAQTCCTIITDVRHSVTIA